MARFSVEAVFKAVDKMTAPISRMQNRVGKMTRSVTSNVDRMNRRMDRISGGVKRAGIAAAATLAISGAALGDIVKVGAEFEQSIVSAAAKVPGEVRKGTEAFKLLEDAAREVGRTTEFTAMQAAKAIDYLAMAGFDAESAAAALPGVVDLATVAQIDLATATDIASDALGAFGLETKNAMELQKNLTRVNDVLAKTSTTANTTIEMMYETIKKSAPIATAAGISMETTAAMIGVMANAGIKASVAGTAVKNAFLNLSSPSSKAADLMKEYKIEILDAKGELLDMPDIINNMSDAFKTLPKPKQLEILDAVFGKNGLAGIATVIAKGGDALRDYRQTLLDAGGASKTMADIIRDTMSGSMKSLESAVESVKISIAKVNEVEIRKIIDNMTAWVRANEALIATKIGGYLRYLIENLDNIVATMKKIGVALVVFYSFIAVLKTLVLVMAAVNLAMSMNPIGLIVIGVTLLISAVSVLILKWEKVVAGIKRAATAVKEFFLGEQDGESKRRRYQPRVPTQIRGMSQAQPQVVTPQDRIVRKTEESREISEVIIKDETGRAEIKRRRGQARALQLQQTGNF